jgi:WD40 repeat protein
MVGFTEEGKSPFAVTHMCLIRRADGRETWPFFKDYHQGGLQFRPLALSPGGRFLLCSFVQSNNRGVVYRVHDLQEGVKVGDISGEQFLMPVEPKSFALSADGKTLVGAVHINPGVDPGRGELCRLDVTTGKLLGAPIKSKGTFSLFGPGDGKTLLVFDSWASTLWPWDMTTGKQTGDAIPFLRGFQSAALAPDGKSALVATPEAGVRLWDLATGKPRGEPLLPGGTVQHVSWSADGRTLATRAEKSGEVRLWDAATLKPLGPVVLTDVSDAAGELLFAFSPDGKRFTAAVGGKLTVYDVPQALEGDAERIRLWVEVNTGKELDAGGALVDLPPAEWLKRWERLQKLGGLPGS